MIKRIVIYAFIGVISVTLAIWAWSLMRQFNYSLSYKQLVTETVKEMVKDECLK